MAVSFATVNVSNLELSPGKLVYNSVDLGATLGNITITSKYTKAPLKMDQLGTTIVDRRVSGLEVTVETEIAEIKNKAAVNVVFPHADLITSGGKQVLVWRSKVGESDQTLAQQLQIFPLSQNSGDTTFAYTFFKALASAESAIVYSPEQQSKWKIIWNILPDFTQTPARFFVFGDPTVGLVNPVAGSAVAGGGNVGNGTILNTLATTSAVTETITAVCVGTSGANSGNFYVSGSVSNALGIVELPGTSLGSAHFNSPVISFDVKDGSTDFAVGDSFTISVTGGNYV